MTAKLAVVGATQKPFPTRLRQHAEDMVEQAKQAEPLRIMLPKTERLCRPASNRLWVLGGLPGSFKTGLAWNIAVNLATLKKRVLYVSLEMFPSRLALKAAARWSGLEERRIAHAFERDGRDFDHGERERFDRAMDKWSELDGSLWIHSGVQDGWTLRDVLHNAKRVTWDAVIVDHLRLLAQDDLRLVGECVEAMRQLTIGKGKRPWVLLVSPLNRDSQKQQGDDEEPSMPKMSDFWGSSAIEYAADQAIILQKRAKLDDESPVVEVDGFVLKNRDGPAPACIVFEANGATTTVLERSKQEAPQQHWSNREPGSDDE